MNENKPPFQRVEHSSALSAKILKMTPRSHTQNITEHSIPGNLIFHPSQTQGSPSLMKLYSEICQTENKTGLQVPLR